MSHKVMLPMVSREYAVTLKEQQDLARRYGISFEDVLLKLSEINGLLLSGAYEPQKTATKTKRIIASHFERSNANGRQGA